MLKPWLRMTCMLGVMESMVHCLHNSLNSCSKKQTMELHALSYNLIMITTSNNRLEVLFQIITAIIRTIDERNIICFILR